MRFYGDRRLPEHVNPPTPSRIGEYATLAAVALIGAIIVCMLVAVAGCQAQTKPTPTPMPTPAPDIRPTAGSIDDARGIVEKEHSAMVQQVDAGQRPEANLTAVWSGLTRSLGALSVVPSMLTRSESNLVAYQEQAKELSGRLDATLADLANEKRAGAADKVAADKALADANDSGSRWALLAFAGIAVIGVSLVAAGALASVLLPSVDGKWTKMAIGGGFVFLAGTGGVLAFRSLTSPILVYTISACLAFAIVGATIAAAVYLIKHRHTTERIVASVEAAKVLDPAVKVAMKAIAPAVQRKSVTAAVSRIKGE
jgi:hypothetical protein